MRRLVLFVEPKSLKEATDRPETKPPSPNWSTSKPFVRASFGRFGDSSPPCRACCTRSDAITTPFHRLDWRKVALGVTTR
jgi:hypothetical protein